MTGNTSTDGDIQALVDERDDQLQSPHDATVAYIRDELMRHQILIREDDLRGRVEGWIQRSLQYTDADTAADYVENRLNQLLKDNEMYNSPDVATGEDAFPDECTECQHYGSRCPVLLDRSLRRTRSRKLDDAETERDARDVYAEQATRVGCVAIPSFLDEWDSKHSELVREGHELLTEVSELIHGDPGEGEDGSNAGAGAGSPGMGGGA